MYQYNFVQWLLFFYFYCFVGWCIESTYVSLKSRKLVNRGFMRGPFLPLYGSGAIMMLVVARPFQGNFILVFVAGMIGATILEYITGVCMESLFKVRYWDYSDVPFNYKGQVCLGTSLAWGGLTIVMTRFLHKPVESFLLSLSYRFVLLVVVVLTVFIVTDLVLSFRAALDLKDILVKMEKAREELEHIQKRLDVIIAVSVDAKEDIITEIETKVEEWKENKEVKRAEKHQKLAELSLSIEEQLDKMKSVFQGMHAGKYEKEQDEVCKLSDKFAIQNENKTDLRGFRGFYRKNLIRSNPSMVSVKFREALEELKDVVNDKKNKF